MCWISDRTDKWQPLIHVKTSLPSYSPWVPFIQAISAIGAILFVFSKHGMVVVYFLFFFDRLAWLLCSLTCICMQEPAQIFDWLLIWHFLGEASSCHKCICRSRWASCSEYNVAGRHHRETRFRSLGSWGRKCRVRGLSKFSTSISPKAAPRTTEKWTTLYYSTK